MAESGSSDYATRQRDCSDVLVISSSLSTPGRPCGSVIETQEIQTQRLSFSRCTSSPISLCGRVSVTATMASSPPISPSWPKRRSRAWALRCEQYCCAVASCFPLVFVYGLTTWAIYVEASIGFKDSRSPWIGRPQFPSS